MPQTVSTSTAATATYLGLGNMVAIASDGTALVIYYNGSVMAYRSAAAPYSTWSAETALTSAGTSKYNASALINTTNDSVYAIYHDGAGALVFNTLTKSGSTWTQGTPVTVTAAGGSGSSGEIVQLLKESGGRLWAVLNQSTTTYGAFYSNDSGATWNTSVNAATMAAGSTMPAAALCGNYLVLIWGEGTNGNMSWTRLDTTGVLTSWVAVKTVQLGNAGGFGTTWNGDYFSFATDGNGLGVAVWDDIPLNFNAGINGATYNSTTDTWTHYAALQAAGGAAGDGAVTAVATSGGDVYAFWPHYAAANSYSLQYVKWDHAAATWGTVTQLEPSGVNNVNPVAGFGNNTIGIAYTTGTATPWNVEFDTLSTGSAPVTHTASGALAQVSALVSHTSSGALGQLTAHATHTSSGALAQIHVGATHTSNGALAQLNAPVSHTASGALVQIQSSAISHTSSNASVEIAKIPPLYPVISRGQPAYASDTTYPPSNANDSDYGTLWTTGTAPSVGSPAYWAVDLSAVPSSQRQEVVFVWYNESGDGYWQNPAISWNNTPQNYTIETNAAAGGTYPTTGWTNVATVTSNDYWTREHKFNLAGANWVRMSVTSSLGTSPNNGVSIQVDIHDAHQGDTDDWLILGDSITAEAWFRRNPDGSTWTHGPVPQQVNTANPVFFPLMIDGGYGGQTMSWGATNISSLIAPFTGHYVAVQYGTNDLNVTFEMSTAQIAAVYTNLLTIIDAIHTAGMMAVVSYVPYGTNNNDYLGINAQQFNAYVDAHLPTDRAGQFIRGPDLYTPFYNNPNLLRAGGIHPTYTANPDGTQTGYDLYHKTWTDWMLSTIYATPLQQHTASGIVAQIQASNGGIETYHTASGWLANVGYPNPHTASGALAQLTEQVVHTSSGMLAEISEHMPHTATGAQAQVFAHTSHTSTGALAQVAATGLITHTSSGAQVNLHAQASHTSAGALANVREHITHTTTNIAAEILRHNTHTTSGIQVDLRRPVTHTASAALTYLAAHPLHTADGWIAQLPTATIHLGSGVMAQVDLGLKGAFSITQLQGVVDNLAQMLLDVRTAFETNPGAIAPTLTTIQAGATNLATRVAGLNDLEQVAALSLPASTLPDIITKVTGYHAIPYYLQFGAFLVELDTYCKGLSAALLQQQLQVHPEFAAMFNFIAQYASAYHLTSLPLTKISPQSVFVETETSLGSATYTSATTATFSGTAGLDTTTYGDSPLALKNTGSGPLPSGFSFRLTYTTWDGSAYTTLYALPASLAVNGEAALNLMGVKCTGFDPDTDGATGDAIEIVAKPLRTMGY